MYTEYLDGLLWLGIPLPLFPHFIQRFPLEKCCVWFFSFDALLFGYSANSVLFLLLHILVILFGISELGVFSPRSPKGSIGTVSVMSSAENGCVPSHLSLLGIAFSSLAEEQDIQDN